MEREKEKEREKEREREKEKEKEKQMDIKNEEAKKRKMENYEKKRKLSISQDSGNSGFPRYVNGTYRKHTYYSSVGPNGEVHVSHKRIHPNETSETLVSPKSNPSFSPNPNSHSHSSTSHSTNSTHSSHSITYGNSTTPLNMQSNPMAPNSTLNFNNNQYVPDTNTNTRNILPNGQENGFLSANIINNQSIPDSNPKNKLWSQIFTWKNQQNVQEVPKKETMFP